MTEEAKRITRTIALTAAAEDASLARVRAAEGVRMVRRSADNRRIEVTYDLNLTDLTQVLAVMASAGLSPSNGFLARWGREWACFREENLRSQARIVHRCCNQPPAGEP